MRTLPLLILLGACATAPAEEQTSGTDLDCTTGEVGNFGVDRQNDPVLRTSEGGRVSIGGPMASAILTLTGATVTVCGEREGDLLVARSFELREVDRMAGYLGILRADGEGYALEPGGERPLIPLGDVPAALGGEVGREVWVAGSWVEGRLEVKSFGVRAGERGWLDPRFR